MPLSDIKILKLLYTILFVGLLLFSCGKIQKTDENYPDGTLFRIQHLDTVNGYKMNIFNNDSINGSYVNPSGDTIETGKSLIIHPIAFSPDTVWNVEVKKLSDPKTIYGVSGHREIKLSEIKEEFIFDSLSTAEINSSTPYEFKNYSGKKIKTGIPIKVKFKKIKIRNPLPVKAIPPHILENSIYDMRNYNTDQGLSSAYIWKIIQDSRGNFWFTTNNGGVIEYNGVDFYIYTKNENLAGNVVYTVLEDRNKNIWFGTSNGLQKYDGNEISLLDLENGLSENEVYCLMEDSKGNIWIGTSGGGLNVFDGENITCYSFPQWDPVHAIWTIEEDKSGNIWFGTNQNNFARYDGNKFTFYHYEKSNPGATVMDIHADKNGNVWMGTYKHGVILYDGKSFSKFNPEKEKDNSVLSITEDEMGNIWYGTYGNGFAKIEDSTIRIFEKETGAGNDYIRTIFFDKAGSLWLGTNGGGISEFKMKGFEHLNAINGLSIPMIWGLDKYENSLYSGSWGGGLYITENNRILQYTRKEGLSDDFIRVVHRDKKGNIWLGNSGQGISKISNGKITHFQGEGKFGNAYILSMLEDSKGNMWFGSSGGGLFKYNGKYFLRYSSAEGLLNNYIMALKEDSNGNIWIGTHGGGVACINGDKIKYLTEKEGLSNDEIWSITTDKNGKMFFGTNGDGIDVFDGTSIKNYSTVNGLSNNYIASFVSDNNNNLWIGTNNGISVLSENGKGEYFVKKTFGKSDGLKAADYYSHSAIVDKENILWMGGSKGLVKLNLNKFKFHNDAPEIQLNHIRVNDNFIDWNYIPDTFFAGKVSVTEKTPFYNYPENLKLDFSFNHLTFYFSARDYSPHKIRYSYKIDELEGSWSLPSENSFADYRNLPYGEFTFKVKATGEAGKWSEPVTYTFTILPPWWHTNWFRVCMVLSFGLFLFLIYRWRTAALRERQKQLEKTVAERTAEVVEEKKEVEHQKELVEEKNKEILDSINYAKRLQEAILPPLKLVKEYLTDSFILYKPKDIVAGDFYFMEPVGNKIIFAAADCTGHGVPGAMVSVVCSNAMNRAVKEFNITDSGLLLNKVRELVVETFEKSESEVKDGMDISLCCLEMDNLLLQWSGANNPLWMFRKGEIVEFKPDKQPIGKHSDEKPFTAHSIQLQKRDTIYIFTDGYQDQFGGDKGKKFKASAMKELLLNIQDKTMEEQKSIIDKSFESWKGKTEQIDDVCVIGVRI